MSETIQEIRERYKTKYLIARSAADERQREADERIPGMRQVHERMDAVGLALLKAAFAPGKDGTASVEDYRAEVDALRAERARLMCAAGYPADYTEVHYDCPLCGDTGYTENGQMCVCLRREITRARYEASGMSERMHAQTFANFSLQYYAPGEEAERMRYNYEFLRNYAAQFNPRKSGNVMLFGGTGLGKTHLSSAVAGEVLKKGYDVCYVTAPRMMGDFEKQRFGDGNGDADGDTAHYFATDLLILDDLGTEVVNQFTASCLYDLITRRMDTGKATLISTNFTAADLRKRYWDRITSRLLGEYQVLLFVGKDVRMQKLTAEK